VKRLLVLPAALALLLAACGDDPDDSNAGETPSGQTATEATEPPDDDPLQGTLPLESDPDSIPDESGSDCGPLSDVWYAPGVLTVATGEPAFPPYVIDDDPSSGEGFESAVVYAVAEQLGFEQDAVTWVRTTFDEAIAPGPKDYDFNIQQYGITEERDEVVDFSLPYYNDQKALLVPGDSPAASAATFADIQDLKYGATIGTTDADYITETIGISEADVAIYDDQAATFAALDAGQIDATVIGLPTAIYITGVEMPQIAIAGLLPRVDDGDEGDMGMLFEESNPARDCVNTAIEALTDDGTLEALEEEWMESGGDLVEITE
jgi:polar amino acid transport system substrate-binding protein